MYSDNNGILRFFGDKFFDVERILTEEYFFLRNKKLFLKDFVFPEQVHSDGIFFVDPLISHFPERSSPIFLSDCDALITSIKNCYLCIKTADCIPVFIFDVNKKAVAVVHSGRDGTQKNIVGQALERFFSEFGSKSDDIYAELGPGISAQNYPVSSEMFESFVAETEVEQTAPFLDLKATIKEQLLRHNVNHITDSEICTYENRQYFSYRRDKTTQRQISLIGIYR